MNYELVPDYIQYIFLALAFMFCGFASYALYKGRVNRIRPIGFKRGVYTRAEQPLRFFAVIICYYAFGAGLLYVYFFVLQK